MRWPPDDGGIAAPRALPGEDGQPTVQDHHQHAHEDTGAEVGDIARHSSVNRERPDYVQDLHAEGEDEADRDDGDDHAPQGDLRLHEPMPGDGVGHPREGGDVASRAPPAVGGGAPDERDDDDRDAGDQVARHEPDEDKRTWTR